MIHDKNVSGIKAHSIQCVVHKWLIEFVNLLRCACTVICIWQPITNLCAHTNDCCILYNIISNFNNCGKYISKQTPPHTPSMRYLGLWIFKYPGQGIQQPCGLVRSPIFQLFCDYNDYWNPLLAFTTSVVSICMTNTCIR